MQEPFNRLAWAYAMLYVNLYGTQLLYSSRKFGQFFLMYTVYELFCVNSGLMEGMILVKAETETETFGTEVTKHRQQMIL